MGASGSKSSEAAGSNAGPSGKSAAMASTCPVPEEVRTKAVYNVYNQRIDPSACPKLDPRNNMPIEPNQQPFPGQRKPISTERIVSSIPKGGTEGTWVYPSPQMFYNALKRKGKGDDVTEDDMDPVVHAHNTMNEVTWQHVLAWERLHGGECGDPRLLRFTGRPDELSPLARLSAWFGGQLPFDRHDWWVDRCGQEVRYVIDFYFHEEAAGTPEAFTLRVRPAIDSVESVVDRTKMTIYKTFARLGLPCPITGSPGSIGKEAIQTEQHS
ncbi:g10318 [Coccomyxa elongata]